MPVSLKRFIQMVANVFDAHTAALFVRSSLNDHLELFAWETLSPHLDPECILSPGQGLVGWVARENQRLHVTRFERDTRTLGLYREDAAIKAFLASPLPHKGGVLMVDSKSRYAFPEKKQRILGDCAALAFDLLNAWKNEKELEFFRAWNAWHAGLSGDAGDVLQSLLVLLGLRLGIVVERVNRKRLAVKAAAGMPAGLKLQGRDFPVEKGLAGWLLRHETHLVLNRFGVDKQKSYLLWPEEPFSGGPVLIGLFQPLAGGSRAWIAAGEADIAWWSGGLADLLVSSIECATYREGKGRR